MTLDKREGRRATRPSSTPVACAQSAARSLEKRKMSSTIARPPRLGPAAKLVDASNEMVTRSPMEATESPLIGSSATAPNMRGMVPSTGGGVLAVEPGVLAAVCADRLLAELWDTRRRCLADEPVVYRDGRFCLCTGMKSRERRLRRAVLQCYPAYAAK